MSNLTTQKQLTAALNKITREKYAPNIEGVLNTDPADLDKTVAAIFECGVTQPLFRALYADVCKDLINIQPTVVQLIQDKCNEQRQSPRDQVNLALFLGHLYLSDVLAADKVHEFLGPLLNGTPSDTELEMASKLLHLIGHRLDTREEEAHMAQYKAQLQHWSLNYPVTRVRFLALNTIEFWNNGWTKPIPEPPKEVDAA
eukprot:TRINITY_DN21238_c0_g1_i1.p1 TRINITY_DN21238_c0_g1~~TRINITY_DN21238_c0_g1_i1.p1  ORF type:complete len:200 (+),score=18.27 TRINITY_DN21238_c0_g1_i1:64-663(+)